MCYTVRMDLVLFCDYGLDDAVATADALLHAAEDGYARADLVAVGGNVPAGVAFRNAKKLLSHLAPSVPVRVVDTADLPQPCEFLKDIHGGDGMGDLFGGGDWEETLGFGQWCEETREFDLLSLGPMTLVPRALARKPRKFVFMGGNIAETPNFRGYEFNHALNRAAFAECVRYPHTAVTMDTCRNSLFNIQEREISGEDVLARLVKRTREMSLSSGEKGCYIWDDIAVKVLRHPDWFARERACDRDGNLLDVARYIGERDYLQIVGE